MKKIILFFFVFISVTKLYSQISFQEEEVTSYTYSSSENKTADIDNDGDMDIVTFGTSNTTIDWYENKFPEEGFMPKKNITTLSGSHSLQSIDVSDFDNDGDLDVLGAELYGDKLFLCTNLDGQGNFGALQVLKTIDNISFVKHIDMDKDGDKDLLFKKSNGEIGYYENTNQATNYIIYHLINNDFINVPHNIQICDLNMDGYPDVFYRFDTVIRWIKNFDGINFSTFTTITSSNERFYRFDINDIDNDGDADLVGYVEKYGNKKLIYILNDGLGNFATEQIILQNIADIKAIKLDDYDNDTHVDILIAIQNNLYGEYFSNLTWYKNNGSYSFTSQPDIDVKVRSIYKIETFNLNNDSNKDILTSSFSHRTTAYKNNGMGVFNTPLYTAAANLQPSDVVAVDIDGDGDIDVITSSKEEGKIYLYKKSNTDETYGNQIIVSHDVSSAKKLAAADIDSDGDLDIVSISGPSTSGYDDKVSWYRNLDGLGNFGSQINIPIGGYDSPDGLAVYDVDADGDKDIVTALDNDFGQGDKIVWYSNDGLGNFSTEIIIVRGLNNVTDILESDIDSDGDNDLFFTAAGDNKIGWFKNLNGLGVFGTEQVITSSASSIKQLSIADLDSDGDKDIIYLLNESTNKVLWQPNIDSLGSFGPPRIIISSLQTNFNSPIVVGDIDNDSDVDIVVGETNKTTWLENLHGQANFEPPKIISSTTSYSSSMDLMDKDNDGDMDLLMAIGGNNKVVWYRNQGVDKNTIKGEVRFDLVGDGCGATDTLLPNILVSTTDGTSTEATFTFRNEFAGQYRLYTGQGNFQTSVIANLPTYFMLTPLSQSSTFTGFGNIATANFCIEPIGQINDLNVALYPLGEARPGFNTSYQLVYKNIGTTTLTGQTVLEYNNTKIQFLNASTVPTSQTTNTLNFDFTNLAPFEVRTVILNFNVFPPPTTNISENLVFTSTVTHAASEFTPNDNSFVLNQQVIGSYDPNDVTCLEGDEVLIANADKYLHYVIRFQNTGTASAINVKVQHLLDQKLDWTTLQLEGMSHNARITIKDESLVEFMFNNINLPHKASNEAGSQGFITFKIKPKTGAVSVGDIVNATANIYFDYNPPITTNTAGTEYVNTLGIDSFTNEKLIIYPNPAKEQLMIISSDEILQVEIYNILGSKVLEEKNKSAINVSNLKSGMYLISITTSNGNCIKKFMKQ